MTQSLIQRINQVGQAPIKAGLNTSPFPNVPGLSYSFGATPAERHQDLRADKYSAALAYLYIEPVRVCVDLYAQAVGRIPYVLYQNKDGKDTEIASSKDKGQARHPLIDVIRQHRRDFHIGYFANLAYEAILYDEMATEFLRPDDILFGAAIARSLNIVTGIKVLRGAALGIEAWGGDIHAFFYNSDEGRAMLPAEDVAYDKGYNPLDFYRGASLTISVLDELNILNDLRRYEMRLLEKADRPDVYASFKDPIQAEGGNFERMEEALKKYRVSPDKTLFLAYTPLDFTTIPAPEANDQMQVDDKTRGAIFRAFGVPMSMAGDTSATKYDEGDPVYANWIKNKVLPLLVNIQDYSNDQILPALGVSSDYRLEFDLSEYEVVTARDKSRVEVANEKFKDGKITLGQWGELAGQDIDEAYKDWRQIEGVLVPPQALTEIWRYKFQAPAAVDFANADKAEAEASTASATPTNTETGSQPLNADAAESDGFEYRNGVAIPQKEVFGYHIDAGIVDINEARAQLGLPPKQKEETNELQDLQAKLSIMNSAVAAGIPTLAAAEMVGLVLPEEVTGISPQQVQSFRSWIKSVLVVPSARSEITTYYVTNHHTHNELDIAPFKSIHADPIEELKAWWKSSNNLKSRSFEQIWLKGDVGDVLQQAIDTRDKTIIDTVFKAQLEALELRAKAIQATRLDFENDFDNLLSRARAEKMGRVQWASAMRAIMRRYGRKAYVDGMADGGVEDEPTEDDNITINELAASQSQYITELGNVLYKEDGISDATADVKAAMWYNKSIDPFYQAGLLSADANGLYEWVFGKTEQHCDSCRRLNGQRHRLKGWKANIMPKSSELDCGGWLCDCNLVKARGRQRGNY